MNIFWNNFLEISLYVFYSAAGIQLLFYILIFSRLIFFKSKAVKDTKEGVSVIVCARNEAKNLQNFLPTILEQKYPNFEVIVVNDASIDDTETVLKQFQNKYKNLYVTNIDRDYNYRQGKKLAITVGIKAAKNDILLFTDADCIVDSEYWIENVEKNFAEGTEIVLGYGGYSKLRGFINKLIRYDTLFIAIQYLSFALIKLPYMGVGRNMAYRKTLFFKNKGFASHLTVPSGDDDLFVNENANKKNTKIVIDKNSFTHSFPKSSFKDWFYQKKRHFSTSGFYKFKHKLLLFLEVLSRILFYLISILLISFNKYLIIVLSIFVVRQIIYLIVLSKSAKKLNEQGLIIFGMFFDFIFPYLNFLIYFSRLFSNKNNKWK